MSAPQLWLQNHNRKLTQDAIDEALMEYIAHVENQRDDLLAALEKIKMHSISLADAQVVALVAIASVKEK